jgi:hypothetical protein
MSHANLRARIDRARTIVPTAAKAESAPGRPADEAQVLAEEAAAAFGNLVALYREDYKLSAEAAVARASDCEAQVADYALRCPPNQLDWFDLDAVARRDPAAATNRWQEIKDAARSELRSGHRSARALQAGSQHCWARARFLAVRAELAAALGPRDSAELLLIDQMATYQMQVWQWQETLTAYALVADLDQKSRSDHGHRREAPRVSDAEALKQAAEMVERFQAMFLKALRAFQGMRRPGSVVVRRAAQVNFAHQQVNVAR